MAIWMTSGMTMVAQEEGREISWRLPRRRLAVCGNRVAAVYGGK